MIVFHKRRSITLLAWIGFLLSFHASLVAQKQNAVWYFGYNAGLDFNTDPPTPIFGELNQLEGCASIADQNGDLLFYTDGITVWDRNHHIMPNGFGLKGGNSSTQSALIVPLPGSCSKYYIFTTQDFGPPSGGGMAYSVLDMQLNDGFGDIITASKNTTVIDSTGEGQAAILHTNGIDIWILTHKFNSIDFYAYLLTSTGLDPTPVISSIGSFYQFIDSEGYTGPIRASHDGTKLIWAATFENICEMFDLNKSTGQLSNPKNLQLLLPGQMIYGVEFSPNDSLLYVGGGTNSLNGVWQINLNQVPAQITPLISFPDFQIIRVGQIQLGINNKIYVAIRSNPTLDVIHQPDKPGMACQYEEGGLLLFPGTSSAFGLPNPSPYSFCPAASLGKDTTICQGDTIRLHLPVNSTANCTQNLSWFDGTTDSIKVFTHPGKYWINVSNSCSTFQDTILVDSLFRSTLDTTICQGQSYLGHTQSITLVDTLSSIRGCDSIATTNLTVTPYYTSVTNKKICIGESFEDHTQSGTYTDTLTDVLGCEYIRNLHLFVVNCDPVIHYDLNSCESIMANGSHLDYSEFTPEYPNVLSCAEISAAHVSRVAPNEYKHSCTPGIDSSVAMCVGTLPTCVYQEGLPACVIIDFTITPVGDSVITFNKLEFYEKGPTTYNWINGSGGTNNIPRYYAIRVLRDGVKIYRKAKTETTPEWTLQTFEFFEPEFRVDTIAHFRIELLPYCPFDNGGTESVWDLDEIKIYASCKIPGVPGNSISGAVKMKNGEGMPNVSVELSDNPAFTSKINTITDDNGHYGFGALEENTSYYIRAGKNENVLNGVSAWDLIPIQKHLLGNSPFLNLGDCVAADVNRNEKISAFDMLQLQKLLLGIQPTFPANTSWRFGVWPQIFETTDLSSFQEVHCIESIHQDQYGLDFIGIKIGDLNGDAVKD